MNLTRRSLLATASAAAAIAIAPRMAFAQGETIKVGMRTEVSV